MECEDNMECEQAVKVKRVRGNEINDVFEVTYRKGKKECIVHETYPRNLYSEKTLSELYGILDIDGVIDYLKRARDTLGDALDLKDAEDKNEKIDYARIILEDALNELM